MTRKSGDRLPPISLARRHFMAIVAAGAGRLSAIAISSSLLAGLTVKDANALGLFPRGNPKDDGDPRGNSNHQCFGRGRLIGTAHGEVPGEDWANGALVWKDD